MTVEEFVDVLLSAGLEKEVRVADWYYSGTLEEVQFYAPVLFEVGGRVIIHPDLACRRAYLEHYFE